MAASTIGRRNPAFSISDNVSFQSTFERISAMAITDTQTPSNATIHFFIQGGARSVRDRRRSNIGWHSPPSAIVSGNENTLELCPCNRSRSGVDAEFDYAVELSVVHYSGVGTALSRCCKYTTFN